MKAKRKKTPAGARIVYNKLLGGWYVVVGPHQTPLAGRFDSKAEAQAWLGRKKNPDIHSLKTRKRSGNWEVTIYPSKHRGYFEHILTGAGGGLWFDNRKSLQDYDGVYELPRHVVIAIRSLGFHVSRDFEPEKREKNPSSAFKKGERVQLHAATSDWMRGDRYGEVVGYGKKAKYRDSETGEIFELRPVRVKLDKSGKIKRFHPDNLTAV